MIRQYELVERVKAYDPGADGALLDKAYVYAMKMHGSQTRANGDPYFSHPLEVAGILTELRLDAASIVTALLHDTVEDTPATLEDIGKQFGPEIMRLVDGVTKLTRLELQSEQSKQAENFRKLVVAMSEDIRVLLVKLADRMHNMRTLHFIPKEEKRKRIARETLDIYAPLADRIGLARVKDELQGLAFAELQPEAYESINLRLAQLREQGEGTVDGIIAGLGRHMKEAGINARISGREKSPYSIWSKMQKKDIAFEQLSDIMAFRVQVDTVEQCYQALGVIHSHYRVVPGRFKDYISTPKPNGYRSIHTGVLGPSGGRVEIQIRTPDMQQVAEMGVAAHWAYKQGGDESERMHDGRQYRWLRQLLEIVENAQRPEEFLEHTKLELFQDQVFCFTPKGDLISLPHGATPLDFAYAVHSQIGDTFVGARVNGRLVPMRTALKNGDQVEISTSKNSTPKPEWERIVVTGKARARIRRFIRNQQRTEYIQLGRKMLDGVFKAEGNYEVSEKILEPVVRHFNIGSVEDLVVSVGSGNISAKEVFHTAFPAHISAEQQQALADQKVIALKQNRPARPANGKGNPIPIKGLISGLAVHYARCCHPIPGDRIVGLVTTGKGVTIHTIDCETLSNYADEPERWLDVAWDNADAGEPVAGRVHIFLVNSPGSLGALSTVVGKNGGNISNLKIISRGADFFEMLIDIDVHDIRHLNNIIAALRATPVVNMVERARTG
ncbi:RelA/SpoT family protein [Radicibacter daui]|uniref:RelA/SpoT family protein n=1 Tax=Radicibacter daui TaxID=3064829 RepID=UPI0040470305